MSSIDLEVIGVAFRLNIMAFVLSVEIWIRCCLPIWLFYPMLFKVLLHLRVLFVCGVNDPVICKSDYLYRLLADVVFCDMAIKNNVFMLSQI
jgi:hypothetical protein